MNTKEIDENVKQEIVKQRRPKRSEQLQVHMEKGENWKPIKGYEGHYEISSLGRIKSLGRVLPHKTFGEHFIQERILKGIPAGVEGDQYLVVWLHSGEGKQKIFRVHRLVAEYFCTKAKGATVVNHLDGDKYNNCADNLEWTTSLGNTQHAAREGFMNREKWSTTRKVINVDTGEIYPSITEAGRKTGIGSSAISHVLRGVTATSGGFRWRYA